MTLVRGNHDDRAGDPPPEAGIDVVQEPWLLGPFACCHHPRPDGDRHPTHFILAGHLHPCVVLGGRAHDGLRLVQLADETRRALIGNDLEAFGEILKQDFDKYARIVKEAGIKPQQ